MNDQPPRKVTPKRPSKYGAKYTEVSLPDVLSDEAPSLPLFGASDLGIRDRGPSLGGSAHNKHRNDLVYLPRGTTPQDRIELSQDITPMDLYTYSQLNTWLNARKSGRTWNDIAFEYDEDPRNISKAVMTFLCQAMDRKADEHIEFELSLLDDLWRCAKSSLEATYDNTEGKGFNKEAFEACMKVLDRRARYLGLDKAPQAQGPVIIDNVTQELITVYIPDNNRDSGG